jgi:hypothetical protein
MNRTALPTEYKTTSTDIVEDGRLHFQDNKMAASTHEPMSTDTKEISPSGAGLRSEVSSVKSIERSTWQTLVKYKGAILWSAFVGLAGINWGMDVLVSILF